MALLRPYLICYARTIKFAGLGDSLTVNILKSGGVMAGRKTNRVFEVSCPECSAMLQIDADTGALISHTPAPRKRTFEDLAAATKAMREQDERKESIFRQSMEAEKNKGDLLEKKFAEALKKAKDAPEGKPLREIDLD
jgi:hypothetical protein